MLLYLLYNLSMGGHHFYTTDAAERNDASTQ
ncbi:MAG: hypothetical protein ACJ8CB_01260 [Ktedonobacteraceae bacterium]